MPNRFEIGSREYFKEEVQHFYKLMEDKGFWTDLNRTQRAMVHIVDVWGKTQNAKYEDGLLMEKTRTDFKSHYDHALKCVMEANKFKVQGIVTK